MSKDRDILADAGFTRIKTDGTWDNLPTGEVFKVPSGRKYQPGVLVIDGALPGRILNKEKIVIHFSNGSIIKIEEKGNQFLNYLKYLDTRASKEEKGGIFKICELGIGINKAARIVESPVKYKRKWERPTSQLEITRLSKVVFDSQHIDMMFLLPTIVVDGMVIMKKGKLYHRGINELCNPNLENYKPNSKILLNNQTKLSASINGRMVKLNIRNYLRNGLDQEKCLLRQR